ncbi:MAG: hypothetical protein KatS3mg131_2372 [Candidatus Tectimicrobiota bacterium]|nr:MAG: hypothetical protein KatS3mg131_2372 [Candidatus Tectomicrobia bacterium]
MVNRTVTQMARAGQGCQDTDRQWEEACYRMGCEQARQEARCWLQAMEQRLHEQRPASWRTLGWRASGDALWRGAGAAPTLPRCARRVPFPVGRIPGLGTGKAPHLQAQLRGQPAALAAGQPHGSRAEGRGAGACQGASGGEARGAQGAGRRAGQLAGVFCSGGGSAPRRARGRGALCGSRWGVGVPAAGGQRWYEVRSAVRWGQVLNCDLPRAGHRPGVHQHRRSADRCHLGSTAVRQRRTAGPGHRTRTRGTPAASHPCHSCRRRPPPPPPRVSPAPCATPPIRVCLL